VCAPDKVDVLEPAPELHTVPVSFVYAQINAHARPGPADGQRDLQWRKPPPAQIDRPDERLDVSLHGMDGVVDRTRHVHRLLSFEPVPDRKLAVCDSGSDVLDGAPCRHDYSSFAQFVYVAPHGPDIAAEQLGEILSDMRRHGARTVLVDGAVDRITQVASGGKAAFVYVAKVEPENLDSSAAGIKLVWSASGVPLCRAGEKLPEPVFIIDGALTAGRIPGKDVKRGTLIMEDLTKVFLTWQQWTELRTRFELRFGAKPDLAAFVVNLCNVSRQDFEKKLGSPELAGRIIYNPYAVAC